MICPNCHYDNAYNHSSCIRCGYVLEEAEIEVLELEDDINYEKVDLDTYLEDIPEFLKRTEEVVEVFDEKKHNLSRLYGIISIALPTFVIMLYILFDFSKIFSIILCIFSYVLACVCEDRHKKLSVIGKVLSGTNAGFLFLEFLLQAFTWLLALYL